MTLLEVRDLRTWFETPRGVVRAVDGVSLRLSSGQTFGIVGESGSGKSALVRSIAGLHLRTAPARLDGSVVFEGVELRGLPRRRLRHIWGARIGIVFQNPMTSLNPVVRIGRQLTEPMREHLGVGATAARTEALELLDAVGIADPKRRFNVYPHELSGGMRQRIAIAIALACKPALLIADEPTTALDVTVQAQILALLSNIQSERQMAMIFVSHDLGVISGLADDIAVMYAGRIVEQGSTPAVIRSARMPYTHALMRSVPHISHPSRTRLPAIPGRPPSLVGEFVGCPFAPRCQWSKRRCTQERPELDGSTAHRYACWFPVDLPATRREDGGRDGERE